MQRGFVVVLLLAGCGRRYDEEILADGLRKITASLKSDRKGTATVKLDFEPDERSFLATAITEASTGFSAHHRELRDPDKTVLFDAFEEAELLTSKTNAGFISNAATLNWPITQEDAPLTDKRWFLDVGVAEGKEYARGDVQVEILVKADDDLSAGSLDVNLFYAGGVDQRDGLVEAVEAAVARWQNLYATINIAVSVSYGTLDETEFQPPGFGTPEVYESVSASTPLRSVNIILAPEIPGYEDVYGISGDIPGPLVSTGRSSILVSMLLAAGTDNRFSDAEIRLLSETMAHETGHYLGLYHPVEAEFDHWDALEDTVECSSESRCFAKLSDNLMFPFPVCGFTLETCTPQIDITEDQAAVVHHHVAVD